MEMILEVSEFPQYAFKLMVYFSRYFSQGISKDTRQKTHDLF